MPGVDPTPASLGFFMPAEWSLHESTWLCWPTNQETWPDCLESVQDVYLHIIGLLCERERVDLLVDDERTKSELGRRFFSNLVESQRLVLHVVPTVDAWIRDYGPNFLLRREESRWEPAFNHWRFNAWGGKYADLACDEVVPSLLPLAGMRKFAPEFVLEGGSIDVDGTGLCMTTEQCLLNANRNPEKRRVDIEKTLKDYLGVEEILWLGQGMQGDDTDGHIDDVARFVDARKVVCSLPDDPEDVNFPVLQDNMQRLHRFKDREGRPVQVVVLPTPNIEGPEGPLPASYANFYIANGLVLVPVFDAAADEEALEVIASVFPRRKTVGINCRQVVKGMGALHCLTQQQPALGFEPPR